MKVVRSDGWVYFLDAVSLGFGIIERSPNDMQKRNMLYDKYPNLPYMKKSKESLPKSSNMNT